AGGHRGLDRGGAGRDRDARLHDRRRSAADAGNGRDGGAVTRVAPEIANLEGPSALPRKNGELVFEAPWEGRAFGIAVALSERGTYGWDEFRERLVERLAGGS